jgi:CRP/FNR family transcriptional regulator
MFEVTRQTPPCHTGSGHVACADCDIRHASVCDALHGDELIDLGRMAQPKLFASRQTLFCEGDAATGLFNVTKGVVRLYRLLTDGRRQIIGFALAGDFLGLSLNPTFGMSADAITEVEACRFDRAAFVACVEAKPHLLKILHEFTSNELLIAREQMVLLGRRTAKERVAAFLLALRDRYQRIGLCDVGVQLPMTRQDIADYCGLTLETVSRAFSKLVGERIILIVPGGVRLLEISRLKTIVA